MKLQLILLDDLFYRGTGPVATINSILTASDSAQTVPGGGATNLNLGTSVNQTGSSFTYNGTDTITIDEAGSYLINVSSVIDNSDTPGDIGITLAINGTDVATASEYVDNQSSAFSGELQHNYNANAGDTITLRNTSSVANIYRNLTVSIIRLS